MRENVPAPSPEPLSAAAVSAFFVRVRQQMDLPITRPLQSQQADVDPRRWAGASKRAGAVAVEF